MQVTLRTEDGTAVTRRTYVLVALAFIGPAPFDGAHVRHLDGNKLNVHAQNLAWGTATDNEDDKRRHGRTACRYDRAIVAAAAERYRLGGLSLAACASSFAIGTDALRRHLKTNT